MGWDRARSYRVLLLTLWMTLRCVQSVQSVQRSSSSHSETSCCAMQCRQFWFTGSRSSCHRGNSGLQLEQVEFEQKLCSHLVERMDEIASKHRPHPAVVAEPAVVAPERNIIHNFQILTTISFCSFELQSRSQTFPIFECSALVLRAQIGMQRSTTTILVN